MEINAQATRQIFEVLYPYAKERMDKAKSGNTRFVHYTSAYAALQIITRETVWLRNAAVMNDFMEVEHGQRCLAAAWNDEHVGGRLQRLLEELQDDLSKEVASAFDQRAHERASQSYLLSISEHGSGTIDEDKYGRLSMWRAYGGDTNVAFVFNNAPFFSESDALNAYTSPVLYCDEEGFKREFSRVVDGLEQSMALAHKVGAQAVAQILETAFHFAALSTKHPGFAEEREWRVICSPTVFPSEVIGFDIETINGVPQRVYKLPLRNFPEKGFTGARLPELLEEVIIGPTEQAWTIRDALVEALTVAGVDEPDMKVRCSNIPLRR